MGVCVLLLLLRLACGSVPPAQLQGLRALFEGCGGNGWLWRSGSQGAQWDFQQPDADPCAQRWQGVACNQTSCSASSACSVWGVSLPAYNLSGSVPAEISLCHPSHANRFPTHTLCLSAN